MCGIVGIIHPSANRVLIEELTEIMSPRGPDGAGYFVDPGIAMGMRRLAVIDLAHGGQPLFSNDQSIVAFQNGEIYNHRFLRAQLIELGYTFRTQSDTEILAHGFHAWGADGLAKRLDGMYAVAIFDRRTCSLSLIRDRFGEKPLFIAWLNDGFAYASDMRILASLPGVGSEISHDALNDYLALHYVPGRRTILKNVSRVLPGEIITIPIENLSPTRNRYYVPPIGSSDNISDEALLDLVESAVTTRLVADVPVGVFLSGGLDSSIVAAIAAQHTPRVSTFSMGFKTSEYDESEYAITLARQLGADHHHFVFDESNFLDLLPKVVAALDEPVGDQALLPVYLLCQVASSHVKVVLSGEGADEVFAGYSYYSKFSTRPTLRDRVNTFVRRRTNRPNERLINNPVAETPSGFPLLTDAAGRRSLIGCSSLDPDQWESELIHWLNHASNDLQRATSTDLATWLPDDLLVKFDRMAMAHSLEGRAPFLEPRLVEAGTIGLRSSDRFSAGVSKVALRRIAKGLLPESTLARKKQGFLLPMRDWICTWAKQHADLAEYFSSMPLEGIDCRAMGESISNSIISDSSRERYHLACIILCEWSYSFSHKVACIRANVDMGCMK